MAGILFFQPVGVYAENIGLGFHARLPDTRTWPAITQCIRRGSMFSIMAHSLSFNVSLRFNPAEPAVGDYAITYSPTHRKESGSVEKVSELDADIDLRLQGLSALSRFKHRYRVITLANDRQRTRNDGLLHSTRAAGRC